jgi:hypothetical protein
MHVPGGSIDHQRGGQSPGAAGAGAPQMLENHRPDHSLHYGALKRSRHIVIFHQQFSQVNRILPFFFNISQIRAILRP